MARARPSRASRRDPPSDLRPGLVISAHGRRVRVADENGKIFRCVLRARLELVTGDRVHWRPLRRSEGIVEEQLARTSVLARPDERGRTRAIAANVDRILVVSATRPALPRSALDAYLVAAHSLDLAASLVFNKIDLLGPGDPQADLPAAYEAIGYPTVCTSTVTGAGLEALVEHIRGEVSVLIGPSGVGKSSLTARLVPSSQAVVGDLVRGGMQGAHTTTATHYYPLPDGGAIIDSPGIREFGLWRLPAASIAAGYTEMSALSEQCRFRNCLHLEEPACAVRSALAEGGVSEQRYQSYRSLLAQYAITA